MANRKSISNKVRFEVFKRDKFTCQYCGKSAPDVVLNVDHIKPVAEGGTNDIMNLVTACFECNNGKSDRELSDDAVIKKQMNQLELLQERREQIEMIYRWQESLYRLDMQEIELIDKFLEEKTGCLLNEYGVSSFKKLIKEFGFATVLESLRIALMEYGDDVSEALDKVGGICFNRTMKSCAQCVNGEPSYLYGKCRGYKCEEHEFPHSWKFAENCELYQSKFRTGDA